MKEEKEREEIVVLDAGIDMEDMEGTGGFCCRPIFFPARG